MRRFFIFLFIFFASLFFSQCEIGKISFAPGDVLMFFINGKVEGKDKKNEIQQINGIKLEAAKKPENEIQMVDQMIVLKEPRPENIHQFTKELTILEQEKLENIVESIDEIVIKAAEKPETKIQYIDEIKLEAAKKPENEIQYIDEFELEAAKKPANEIKGIDKIELKAAKKPENEIKIVEQMTVLKKPRQENVVQNTDGLIILKQEKPENIVESIDEIVINADEKPESKFQHIARIELEAKKKEQNILQNIQEISILAKQRYKNEIGGNESITLLEKEKPQIEMKKNDAFCFSGVARPQNEIENKDEILIEEKKKEDLQIVTVDNLLFSKKEQQKKTNELCKADKFQILCAEKKNQNSICRTEPFEIVTVIPRKFRVQVLSSISNEKFSFLPKVKTNKNNRIINVEHFKIISEGAVKILEEKKEIEDELKNLDKDEEYIKRFLNSINGDEQNGENQNTIERKENFQIKGKESAEVIELKKKADEMHKALQEYEKTPCAKNPGFKKDKYQESGIILSQDNTQKNSRGYSRDKDFIDEQNEIKEERQSMLSSISRNLDFSRPASHSPRKNNRNSFFHFFDVKKFYTDPREKKIEKSKIDDIPQRVSYLFLADENVLNNKVRNVCIDFKECHETSFQIKNGNEEKKLNNPKEVVEKKEGKKFKKINIKMEINNKNKERETTAVNTSKDVIFPNKSTTNGSKKNVIKGGLKNSKNSKLNVAGKKLGPRTSFNTINNRSNTSLSNSVMYVEKMEDKNIINNTFEQKKKKKNLEKPRKNEKKDIKRFPNFGGVKEDVSHNFKKQTEIKKDLLKKKKK